MANDVKFDGSKLPWATVLDRMSTEALKIVERRLHELVNSAEVAMREALADRQYFRLIGAPEKSVVSEQEMKTLRYKFREIACWFQMLQPANSSYRAIFRLDACEWLTTYIVDNMDKAVAKPCTTPFRNRGNEVTLTVSGSRDNILDLLEKAVDSYKSKMLSKDLTQGTIESSNRPSCPVISRELCHKAAAAYAEYYLRKHLSL